VIGSERINRRYLSRCNAEQVRLTYSTSFPPRQAGRQGQGFRSEWQRRLGLRWDRALRRAMLNVCAQGA